MRRTRAFCKLLSQTTYNLPTTSTAHSDCPRFTERRDWVAEWNGDDGGTYSTTEEAVVTFGAEAGDVQTVTLPDGTTVKEFNHTTGWRRGLTYQTETWAGGMRRKWTTLEWEQDAGPAFRQNPRVKETNIWDAEGNRRRRTTVEYHPTYAVFGLPWNVVEYGPDGVTAVRRTYFDYKMEAAYVDRRVIGLLYQKQVFDGAWNPQSREVYGYDLTGELFVDTPAAATQHDRANYGPSFVVGRGNLQHVIRMDVTDPGNSGKWQETKFRYDTVGALRAARDHDWHESSFGYADSFSDNVNRNTFAYPTTATDAGGHSSTAKYDFHTGAVTRTQDPKGAVKEMQYDAVGRLEKVTTPFDGAFTQWSYPSNHGFVQQFSTVTSAAAESYSIKMLDGAGRVVSAATGHPYSQGGYRAQHFTFDVMGRMTSQTNPGEIDGWWNPAGDDSAGWQVTTQTYDWNGRPLVTTNPGPTTRTVTYEGCGCAGSQIVTTTDEVGRERRATYDALGRLWKSEVLDSAGNVYRTVTNTYNALDQITQVSDQAAGGATQITTMTYDGHGRLLTRKYPHESAATTFAYKRDDLPESVTDGRGVTNTFSFNTRHLLTAVNYGTAGGVEATPNLSYDYDEAGNRTQMVETSQGQTDYTYDVLSRLKTETRQFAGLAGSSYSLSYEYNLAGQLKELKDHTNASTYYNYDSEGRPHSVTAGGSTYGGVTTYASGVKYRAWGAMKSLTYGNQMWLSAEYDSRMRMSRFQVGGVNSPYSPTAMLSDFRYDADGSLRFASAGSATDGLVSAYDRAYKYDHAGRLVEAFTSQQANDYNQTGAVGVGGGQYVPYRQTYSYDAWGNQTYRDNWFWERQDIHTANFTDNRRTENGWQYDGAGNPTQAPDRGMTYDAAGRNRKLTSPGFESPKVFKQWHDGDGRVVKRLEEEGTTAETVFYLSSSVLGGAVVAELNAQGVKTTGKVYLGGTLIAEHGEHQPSGARWVEWKHDNPATGTSGASDSGGYYQPDEAGQLDPMGVAIGPPTLFYPEEGISDQRRPLALAGPVGICTWDEIPIFCAEAAQVARTGMFINASQIRTATIYSRSQNRAIGLAVWDAGAAADGVAFLGAGSTGFLPAGVRYLSGTGFFGQNVTRWFGNVGAGGGPHQDFLSSRAYGWMASITAAVSGQRQDSQYLQPPRLQGNPTQAEVERFNAAYKALAEKISTRKSCADLFGGPKKLDKILKTLHNTKYTFEPMGGPMVINIPGRVTAMLPRVATTKGDSVKINSQGYFMAENGAVAAMAPYSHVPVQIDYYGLDDVSFAGVALGHELGHRLGVFKDDKDDDDASAEYSKRVYENCFKE